MAHFIEPDSSVRESFLAAVAEFEAEGAGNIATIAWRDRWAATWDGAAGFADFAKALRDDALPETPRADDWVPCTTLWWVDGSTYLGRLSIRHHLKGWLEEVGGHIGYDVRPSARRQGHATAMLRTALPVAASLGIDKALVTCDDDNLASRRVIETNGGVFEDVRDHKMRFWVPTAP
ncbi:MAG TPA: GNAT family N-acetyltransferase [Marmoricola sp.]